jgi:hypothetical protein
MKSWELNWKRKVVIYMWKPRKQKKNEWQLFRRPTIPQRRKRKK